MSELKTNPMDNAQSKRDKFVSLAEKRVNKTIKDIRLIGNLFNKANYDYADDDIIKIFEALQGELQEAQGRFSATEGGKEDNFSLT